MAAVSSVCPLTFGDDEMKQVSQKATIKLTDVPYMHLKIRRGRHMEIVSRKHVENFHLNCILHLKVEVFHLKE